MVHRTVYSTGGRYGTRMLTAGEPMTLSGPAARAALALGRATEKPIANVREVEPRDGYRRYERSDLSHLDHDNDGKPGGSISATGDEIAALRAEYTAKFGKRPFNGWDAATLRERIAAA